MSIQDLQNSLQELFNNDDYQKAIGLLNGIIDNHSSDELIVEALYQLGRIHFYNRAYEISRNIFINLLKVNPHHYYAKVFLARILQEQSLYNSSVKLIAQAYLEKKIHNQLFFLITDVVERMTHDDIDVQNLDFSRDNMLHKKGIESPLVSIIILCYNKVEHTEKCLESLFRNTSSSNFETIIVDNASVDDTSGLLESYGTKLKFIHSLENRGFVGGNNLALQYAQGDFVVFLNNDTEVQPLWLENLYKTFVYYKDAGAAGAKLIYPNGKLQEAGGVIFNDMNGWNYGKNDNPYDSKYSYIREVDYCSGAALMVKKDILMRIGGFDERFAPAYCEDTDLCFNIRKLGLKVYYNPFSTVIHYEGATAGTDLNSGFKRFQVINNKKFAKKWEEELSKQYPNNPNLRYLFSDRRKGKNILIIDDIPPLPDRAAGALRHYHTLTQMLNLGYKITYVHLMGKQYSDNNAMKYINSFRMRGVEFVWFNYEYWWSFRETEQAKEYIYTLVNSLDLPLRHYDAVYIAFWHIAEYFIDLIRSQIPNVPILIDTMDIHYVREIRQAEINKDKKQMQLAIKNKQSELNVYEKADCITTVTEKDRAELQKELKNKPIFILTDVHDIQEETPKYKTRKDLIFVGNFNHNPNEDAVLFFVKEIFPKVKKSLPDCNFYVVGNNPTQKIKDLEQDDIIVTGYVPDIKEYLDKCLIEVVPLRFGAGNKGKVGEALSNGLPIVTTNVGAEGMGIEHKKHAYVTDDPKEFASYIIDLYTDELVWSQFSDLGKKLIHAQYSSELMRKRLEYIYSYKTRQNLKSYRALKYSSTPIISIVIVVYNQFEFTLKCLNSIREKVTINHEIIVIDNASTDKLPESFEFELNFIRYYRNDKNLGFPNAVNQGISLSIGDYFLILNNDTILTENLLGRMLEIAESNPQIGIVGPISNEVSGLQKDKNAKYKSIEEMHKYAANIAEKNKGEILEFPRVAFLCTLIKKEVIDKIGGLDERFSPGNYEDDDFCLRAQLACYKTVIAKDVFIHHYGSKSFKANGEKAYQERLDINKKIFVDKWSATPDEIWLQNKSVNPRQTFYPINKDLFTQFFERTNVHLADNELDLAEESIAKAIENFESGNGKIDRTELLNLAGNISLATGNLEKAQEYFAKELDLTPSSSSACLGLGNVFIGSEQFENAKTMLEWAVKNDQSNQLAKDRLSEVNQLLGFAKDHNNLFEDADDSANSEEIIQNIVDYFVNDKFSEAINIIESNEKIITQYLENLSANDYAEFYNMKGFIYLSFDKDIARTCFEDALNANPTSSQACVGLGEVFFIDNMIPEAKTMYEWGAVYDSQNQIAIDGLARLNELLGYDLMHNTLLENIDFEEVFNKAAGLYKESKFQDAIDLIDQNENGLSLLINNGITNVEFSTLLNLKGFCYLGLNDEENAELAFGKSINTNPESSQACAGIGVVFLSQGRTQDAKTMLEWALKNDTSNAIAKASLAKANEMLGYPENHNSLFDGVSFETVFVQAYNYFINSDFSSIINLFDQHKEELAKSVDNGTSKEDYASLLNLKGYAYLSLDDIDNARESFELALNTNPESSQACTGLGEVFLYNNQMEEAKTMFEWGVKNAPQNKFAIDALANVNKLLGLNEEHSSLTEA